MEPSDHPTSADRETGPATETGLLRGVDAVTVPVPDLDAGLRFYCDGLGHRLKWRHDDIGQAGLEVVRGGPELVLTIEHEYEPDWLVESVDEAVAVFRRLGGGVVVDPHDIPVGRLAVVADPFGNALVVLELSKGVYVTDDAGRVVAVERRDGAR